MTYKDSEPVDSSVEESQNNLRKRQQKGEFVSGVSSFRNYLGKDSQFPPDSYTHLTLPTKAKV